MLQVLHISPATAAVTGLAVKGRIMDIANIEKKYEPLSPFELKDKLISMSQNPQIRMMLNAGLYAIIT